LNRTHIASGSKDTTIIIWDIVKGICITTFKGQGGAIKSITRLSFSQIASVCTEYTFKIWDLVTGNCTKTISITYYLLKLNKYQIICRSSTDTDGLKIYNI